VAFKHGKFIDVDPSTRDMLRCDYARIKIVINKLALIDASMTVKVLGKNFVIKVMEEIGGNEVVGGRLGCDCARWREEVSSRGSGDGGSAMAVVVGSVEDESDGDWSERGQVLLGAGGQEVGQGHEEVSGKNCDHEVGETVFDSNVLGNFSGKEVFGVNSDTLAASERRQTENDKSKKVEGMLEYVEVPFGDRGHVLHDEGDLVGSKEATPSASCGLEVNGPIYLRTKKRGFSSFWAFCFTL
jgi:hypothetical protein